VSHLAYICRSWFRKASPGHASSALAALRQQSAVLARMDVYVDYAAVGTGDPLILQVRRNIWNNRRVRTKLTSGMTMSFMWNSSDKKDYFRAQNYVWYDSWRGGGSNTLQCTTFVKKFGTNSNQKKLDSPSMGDIRGGVVGGYGDDRILFSTGAVCRFSASQNRITKIVLTI